MQQVCLHVTLQWIVSGIFVKTPAEDFTDEWETGVNTADVSNVVGHLCQDYLQLNATDHRPVLPVFQMGRI